MLRLAGLAHGARPRAARSFSSALVDGLPAPAVISMHDLTFLRGDGAFDVVSLLPSPTDAAVGVPLGLKLHLDRMGSTCRSLRLPLPHDLGRIGEWVREFGRTQGPGSCRVIVTRGAPGHGVDPKCLMLHDPPAKWPQQMRLKSVDASWHFGYALPPLDADKEETTLGLWSTIKWTSYAANCLMTRIAQEQGADDALLVAADGRVLDGPNFAVGFFLGGQLRLVDPRANRMLPSCTQMLAIQAARSAAIPMQEGLAHG